MSLYGVIRLLSDQYGPGIAWSTGHALLLLGALGFIPVFLFLGTFASGSGRASRINAAVGAVLGVLGSVSVAVQAAIDLYAAAVSGTQTEMVQWQLQFQSQPLVMPLIYSVVPMCLYLGLIYLAGVLAFARPRPVPVWIPITLVLGVVAMLLGLDFISLGTLLLAVALAPLARFYKADRISHGGGVRQAAERSVRLP
ncbi:hypothetical protein ACQPYK_04870 [Streptosporangium sp. CA-135522]|uniref:hypothetical protein n=1 Tax=Streptosporangium sp. CA-135522 TaxID=3240072 RepID=UPI003D90DC2E